MTFKQLAANLRAEIDKLDAELEQFLAFGCEGYDSVEFVAEKEFFEGRIFALSCVLADVEGYYIK